MRKNLDRWLLVPAVAFLGAGLAHGGADLPSRWGVLLLGVPLTLLLAQVFRPTRLGWHLAFGSFCLLVLTTLILDLTVAVPRGLPPLSASAGMVILFGLQFGVPTWMIWLAKPRCGHRGDRRPGLSSRQAHDSAAAPGSAGSQGQGIAPPDHPLRASAGLGVS